MNGKPPLAVSPRRLRPRRPPSSVTTLQTSTVKTKSNRPTLIPARHSIAGEPILRKDYSVLSFEATDLPNKAKDDPLICTKPLFERGRFYELYSARRNERLKRKMIEFSEDAVAVYPEAAAELSKKRSLKKLETPRKSCPANFSVSQATTLRTSYKEKPKVSLSGVSALSSVDVGRKMITRSALKKAAV